MINNVVLCGRLTAAPELKQTSNNIPVTAFCVAVDRRHQKDKERQTDFINCVAWRNTAEFICKYFKKGDPIAVQGEIQTRKYQDKNGNNRTAVEVVVNDGRFVPAKSNNNNNDSEPTASNDDAPPVNNDFTDADEYGDLPF